MKIYLDTSVISALFDKRNPERKALTEDFFRRIVNWETYISELTIVEIERTPDPTLLQKMKDTISGFSVIDLTDAMEMLAKEYILYDALPKSYFEDAYHIAAAVISEMDYLLSWNFRHIVRNKTRDIVRMVNTMKDLKHVGIMTPAELL